MPDRDENAWGDIERPSHSGLTAAVCARAARALEAEAHRWFLWLPVLFAAGILSYFALSTEPDPHIPAALVLAAIGLFVARQSPLRLSPGRHRHRPVHDR